MHLFNKGVWELRKIRTVNCCRLNSSELDKTSPRHLLYSVITSCALSSQSVEQTWGNLCHCVQEAYAYLSKHTSICVSACSTSTHLSTEAAASSSWFRRNGYSAGKRVKNSWPVILTEKRKSSFVLCFISRCINRTEKQPQIYSEPRSRTCIQYRTRCSI